MCLCGRRCYHTGMARLYRGDPEVYRKFEYLMNKSTGEIINEFKSKFSVCGGSDWTSVLLIVGCPLLYSLIVTVNLVMIRVFLRQLKDKDDQPYYQQVAVCLTDVFTVHLNVALFLFRHLNFHLVVPCWLFRDVLRWQLFDVCSLLISPALMIGVNLDRLHGLIRVIDYRNANHRRRVGLNLTWSCLVYIGSMFALHVLAGDGLKTVDINSSGQMRSFNQPYEMHQVFYRGARRIVPKRWTYEQLKREWNADKEGDKIDELSAFYNVENWTSLIDRPLRLQQQIFCSSLNNLSHQDSLMTEFQPPHLRASARNNSNKNKIGNLHGVVIGHPRKYPELSRLPATETPTLELRLPCPYTEFFFTARVLAGFFAIVAGLIGALVGISCYMAVVHRRVKIQSAITRNTQDYRHSNVIFIVIFVQTLLQVLSVSLILAQLWNVLLIRLCDQHGGTCENPICFNWSRIWFFKNTQVYVDERCRIVQSQMILFLSYIFASAVYIANFAIFILLSKSFRAALCKMLGRG